MHMGSDESLSQQGRTERFTVGLAASRLFDVHCGCIAAVSLLRRILTNCCGSALSPSFRCLCCRHTVASPAAQSPSVASASASTAISTSADAPARVSQNSSEGTAGDL